MAPNGGEGRVNPATAQRRARRLSFLTAVALVATAFFVPASTAAAPPADVGFRDGRYIVTFVDAPVAEYDGYVDGYAATEPRAGRKLNAHSNAADRWSNRLTRIHDRALGRVGASKIYDYTVTNNGVAAQADRQAGGRRWPRIRRHRARAGPARHPDTTASPHFLGLDAGAACGRSSAAPARPAPASSSASSTPASGPRARRSPATRASRSRPTGTASAWPASSSRRPRATTS